MQTPPTAQTAATDTANTGSLPWPSPFQAWFSVAVIGLTVMTLFGNAAMIGLLMQSIKLDLQLTDTQVSLVVGFAASAFTAFASLPVSRLVDTTSRRLIIGVGMLLVGCGSFVTGLVTTFGGLFLARMAAGLGGAGHGPACYSLLADNFPPAKLPKAIAFMNFGFTTGSALATLLGAALIAALSSAPVVDVPLLGVMKPWQFVFILLALPDLVLGVLALTAMKEPMRRGVAAGAVAQAAPPLREVVNFLWTRRAAFGPMFLGLAINCVAMGAAAWAAPFYQRTYGWSPVQYGFYSGLVMLLVAPFALAFGGWLAERWAKAGRDDANMRVVVLAALLHAPFAMVYALMPSPQLALACSSASAVLTLIGAGPQNAALQVILPNAMRGQVTALYLFLFTMIGFGLSPTVIALITDYVFHDESKLRYSIAMLQFVLAPAALYVFWRGLKGYAAAVADTRSWTR